MSCSCSLCYFLHHATPLYIWPLTSHFSLPRHTPPCHSSSVFLALQHVTYRTLPLPPAKKRLFKKSKDIIALPWSSFLDHAVTLLRCRQILPRFNKWIRHHHFLRGVNTNTDITASRTSALPAITGMYLRTQEQ